MIIVRAHLLVITKKGAPPPPTLFQILGYSPTLNESVNTILVATFLNFTIEIIYLCPMLLKKYVPVLLNIQQHIKVMKLHA